MSERRHERQPQGEHDDVGPGVLPSDEELGGVPEHVEQGLGHRERPEHGEVQSGYDEALGRERTPASAGGRSDVRAGADGQRSGTPGRAAQQPRYRRRAPATGWLARAAPL